MRRLVPTTVADENDDGSGSSSGDVDSDDTSDDSASSDDASSSEDETGERPGFVQRVTNAIHAKQHTLLESRRHPVLEWKRLVQWTTESAAERAAAAAARERREARKAAKAATRERKAKRWAQRALNQRKEREFRSLFQAYDEQLTRSHKRTELLTAFSSDTRTREKQRLAAAYAALSEERERAAKQALEERQRRDHITQIQAAQSLQFAIDAADEIGRRSGVLPAINTPSQLPQSEQDETSSLLILRVNPPSEDLLARRSPLPAFQPRSLLDSDRSSSTRTTIANTPGDHESGRSRPPLHRSLSPSAGVVSKRLFFTVNLKRFKHTEEIKGEAIGDPGGVELARSLLTGACPRVKRLSLGWNRLTFAGVAALADAFVRGACSQLHALDLRWNSINARSLIELLRVLEKGGLPELQDLVLQGNVLGDDGAKALAHAMLQGTLQALRRLDVRQNGIRNAGVQAIWNVFTAPCFKRYCPKLELLDVRRNDASGALTRSLCPCPPYLQF